MSIQFKTVRRAEPGVVGGGQFKYYAAIERDRQVQMRQFIKAIWARSTVNMADVYAVIETFLQLIPEYLLDGRPIELGPLGKFSIGISSTGHLLPEEVNVYSIRNTRILFTPGNELKDQISLVKFVKVENDKLVLPTDVEPGQAA
ncbi:MULTISPECIES: HU family DNA-binding protein [unclassified Imperialibacter]|uniref:HU family DNA-binding protein n=1 Tax=unclassified Imperialibacter TaxID=2629706 RepID=UPI001255A628|nr:MULTISPECIES: HU family DNA-binding protein [unclassified Imperialibacter]CAD5252002.1 putative DNA-binding protein, histone-like [Imperialibacter sp. 89]CAD5265065.1 putative DNA-binding protein, histone-like [Imperialibacter sp. 75]VVT03358.1 putative DNA-binding protein, histone-like [Imperialibacter sp. EC-SDR9]